MKRIISLVIVFGFLFSTTIVFQNCGSGFESAFQDLRSQGGTDVRLSGVVDRVITEYYDAPAVEEIFLTTDSGKLYKLNTTYLDTNSSSKLLKAYSLNAQLNDFYAKKVVVSGVSIADELYVEDITATKTVRALSNKTFNNSTSYHFDAVVIYGYVPDGFTHKGVAIDQAGRTVVDDIKNNRIADMVADASATWENSSGGSMSLNMVANIAPVEVEKVFDKNIDHNNADHPTGDGHWGRYFGEIIDRSGINVDDYDRVIIFIPYANATGGSIVMGNAHPDYKYLTINTNMPQGQISRLYDSAFSTISHEFGHTVGLEHSGKFPNCPMDDPNDSSDDWVRKYCDPHAIMGNYDSMHIKFNVQKLNQLGFLDANETLILTNSESVSISDLHATNNNPKAVYVSLGDNQRENIYLTNYRMGSDSYIAAHKAKDFMSNSPGGGASSVLIGLISDGTTNASIDTGVDGITLELQNISMNSGGASFDVILNGEPVPTEETQPVELNNLNLSGITADANGVYAFQVGTEVQVKIGELIDPNNLVEVVGWKIAQADQGTSCELLKCEMVGYRDHCSSTEPDHSIALQCNGSGNVKLTANAYGGGDFLAMADIHTKAQAGNATITISDKMKGTCEVQGSGRYCFPAPEVTVNYNNIPAGRKLSFYYKYSNENEFNPHAAACFEVDSSGSLTDLAIFNIEYKSLTSAGNEVVQKYQLYATIGGECHDSTNIAANALAMHEFTVTKGEINENFWARIEYVEGTGDGTGDHCTVDQAGGMCDIDYKIIFPKDLGSGISESGMSLTVNYLGEDNVVGTGGLDGCLANYQSAPINPNNSNERFCNVSPVIRHKLEHGANSSVVELKLNFNNGDDYSSTVLDMVQITVENLDQGGSGSPNLDMIVSGATQLGENHYTCNANYPDENYCNPSPSITLTNFSGVSLVNKIKVKGGFVSECIISNDPTITKELILSLGIPNYEETTHYVKAYKVSECNESTDDSKLIKSVRFDVKRANQPPTGPVNVRLSLVGEGTSSPATDQYNCTVPKDGDRCVGAGLKVKAVLSDPLPAGKSIRVIGKLASDTNYNVSSKHMCFTNVGEYFSSSDITWLTLANGERNFAAFLDEQGCPGDLADASDSNIQHSISVTPVPQTGAPEVIIEYLSGGDGNGDSCSVDTSGGTCSTITYDVKFKNLPDDSPKLARNLYNVGQSTSNSSGYLCGNANTHHRDIVPSADGYKHCQASFNLEHLPNYGNTTNYELIINYNGQNLDEPRLATKTIQVNYVPTVPRSIDLAFDQSTCVVGVDDNVCLPKPKLTASNLAGIQPGKLIQLTLRYKSTGGSWQYNGANYKCFNSNADTYVNVAHDIMANRTYEFLAVKVDACANGLSRTYVDANTIASASVTSTKENPPDGSNDPGDPNNVNLYMVSGSTPNCSSGQSSLTVQVGASVSFCATGLPSDRSKALGMTVPSSQSCPSSLASYVPLPQQSEYPDSYWTYDDPDPNVVNTSDTRWKSTQTNNNSLTTDTSYRACVRHADGGPVASVVYTLKAEQQGPDLDITVSPSSIPSGGSFNIEVVGGGANAQVGFAYNDSAGTTNYPSQSSCSSYTSLSNASNWQYSNGLWYTINSEVQTAPVGENRLFRWCVRNPDTGEVQSDTLLVQAAAPPVIDVVVTFSGPTTVNAGQSINVSSVTGLTTGSMKAYPAYVDRDSPSGFPSCPSVASYYDVSAHPASNWVDNGDGTWHMHEPEAYSAPTGQYRLFRLCFYNPVTGEEGSGTFTVVGPPEEPNCGGAGQPACP